MDIVLSLLLLLVLGPLIGVITLAVLSTSGRPAFYRQRRAGLNGAIFTMHKFRTMRPLGPEEDKWDSDAVRVTRLGSMLRRSSLDELPELTHVLSGRMSIVGPRPLLEEYLVKYTPEQARRHDMRPGITGLAQVNGRRRLTLGQRLALDVQYIETWSLVLDLRILFRTVRVLFSSGDIAGQTLSEVDDVGFYASNGEKH